MSFKACRIPNFCVMLLFGGIVLFGSACRLKSQRNLHRPPSESPQRIQLDSTTFVLGSNRLQFHAAGLWEMYLEGDAYTRGWSKGMLAKELIHSQEQAFIATLEGLVPNANHQWLVKRFLRYFNRDIENYLQPEYKEEIKGVSQFTSAQYNYIAPSFERLLYFHAAHDLGHALRDLALVGCTSVALWGDKTEDGKLLIGRNFDFYAGDAFAEQKMVVFIRPKQGIPHAMVTWPGMVGAVSGMNLSGITVTINAGKSNLPHKAKTPISLLSREILQHAHTIEDAIRIASKRQVFVAESIMVASGREGKVILLEVSPRKMDTYEVDPQRDHLISTNHFKSEGYRQDKRNWEHARNSHSVYRFERMEQLIEQNKAINPAMMAEMLRDRRGLDGSTLGMGNEKAINQLIAHHAVLFQPEDLHMWVSTAPYQLGTFVGYRLEEVFGRDGKATNMQADDLLTIAPDPFIYTDTFQNYQLYRMLTDSLKQLTPHQKWTEGQLSYFAQLNPDFWKTHDQIGEYHYTRKDFHKALAYFETALNLEVSSRKERMALQRKVNKVRKKVN
jgi:predicted choloylglycine hydrolase